MSLPAGQAWHSLGSAVALRALSPCLAVAPGSQGFVSAFPFLPAGLALQSGSQEQEQDLVYQVQRVGGNLTLSWP